VLASKKIRTQESNIEKKRKKMGVRGIYWLVGEKKEKSAQYSLSYMLTKLVSCPMGI